MIGKNGQKIQIIINDYINYDIHACTCQSMYGLILNTVEQSIAKKKDIGGELEGGLREWYDGKEKEEVIALDHNVNWTVMQPSAGGHIK